MAALKSEFRRNLPDARGVRPVDEFAGDEEAFCAYRRHEAAGHVSIVGAKR